MILLIGKCGLMEPHQLSLLFYLLCTVSTFRNLKFSHTQTRAQTHSPVTQAESVSLALIKRCLSVERECNPRPQTGWDYAATRVFTQLLQRNAHIQESTEVPSNPYYYSVILYLHA